MPTGLIVSCGEVAVGDWLLIDPHTRAVFDDSSVSR